LPAETIQKYPGAVKLGALLERYLAAGTDPLEIVLSRAKARKLPVWAGFRDPGAYNRFFPESWHAAHPEFHLSPKRSPWYPEENGVNFALPEVRQHKVREWTDVVARYDVEGLHLAFWQALPFFEKAEPKKIEHMNTLLRMLRKELDRIGQAKGKRVKLAIWLPTPYHLRTLRGTFFPSDFYDLKAQGLEPETWIKERLVDILMPSIYAVDLADAMGADDPPSWAALAKGTSTQVYACVMNITWGHGLRPDTAAKTVRILKSLSSQYDGVFLFNSQPYSVAAVLEAAAAASAVDAQPTLK
jgi:uncharacterized lipoprotein YddW (UPF0748 family)